jgi:DNA-binding CsgD family transcriptional regulator
VGVPTVVVTGARQPAVDAERDRLILQYIAEGLDTDQIAVEVGWANSTVKNRVHALIARYGAKNRPHLVALAVREQQFPSPTEIVALRVVEAHRACLAATNPLIVHAPTATAAYAALRQALDDLSAIT